MFPTNLLINSVSNNKLEYTKKQIDRAATARKIYHTIGWPSTDNFKYFVKNNMLRNCNIDVDDINRAEVIYGKPKPIIKGKMVTTKQKSKELKVIKLPLDLQAEHRDVSLYVD